MKLDFCFYICFIVLQNHSFDMIARLIHNARQTFRFVILREKKNFASHVQNLNNSERRKAKSSKINIYILKEKCYNHSTQFYRSSNATIFSM